MQQQDSHSDRQKKRSTDEEEGREKERGKRRELEDDGAELGC